jgi:hypothetical protein
MTDLDSKIVAELTSGLSEREVARRHGRTIEEVLAAVDRRAARMFDPDTVLSLGR